MGWCHEFGPQIQDGCSHRMVAEAACCTCRECGAICRGRFNGCPAVWASAVHPVAPPAPFSSRWTATVSAAAPATSAFEPAPANPLAKRPKHRNKYLAKARAAMGQAVVIVDPYTNEPIAEDPFAPPAGVTPSAAEDVVDYGEPVEAGPPPPPPVRPPTPHGLDEVRERLEGLRGQILSLESTLKRTTKAAGEARSGD